MQPIRLGLKPGARKFLTIVVRTGVNLTLLISGSLVTPMKMKASIFASASTF
jgi:hypothetical protein